MTVEKKNYIVAIDLGSSNVVVAVAVCDETGHPTLSHIVSHPSQGVKAGLITNIEQVSTSIKAAVDAVGEKLGINIGEAYIGISGEFVRCARHTDHVFTSDPQNGVNRNDMEALYARMRNVQAPDDETIMERIPQNYLVDNNQEVADPIGSFGKRLTSTFNFILSAKTPIERLNLALRRVGIRPLGLYSNALATAAAVLTPDEKEEGAAVVNIGGDVTDVTVYYRNVPRYIASIPMGAGAINHDIRTLGILERHVDSLKCKYGSAVAEMAPNDKIVRVKGRTARETKEIQLRHLAVVIEARARDIAEYALQEIKDSGFSRKLAYGIVLTGGSAQLQHIDELFRRVTGMDVRIGTAADMVDEASHQMALSPAYATAIGLMLYGAPHGACAVTAMPRPASPHVPTETSRPAASERPSVAVQDRPVVTPPSPQENTSTATTQERQPHTDNRMPESPLRRAVTPHPVNPGDNSSTDNRDDDHNDQTIETPQRRGLFDRFRTHLETIFDKGSAGGEDEEI